MPKRNAGDDLVDRLPGTTCVSKCFPFSRLRHRGEMSALLTNRPSPARNWKLKSGSQPDNRPSRASSVKKPTLSLPTLSPGSPLAPLTLYCQRKRSFKSSVASQDWGGSLCQKQCNLKLELSTDLDVFSVAQCVRRLFSLIYRLLVRHLFCMEAKIYWYNPRKKFWQFCTTCLNIIFVGVQLGWTF